MLYLNSKAQKQIIDDGIRTFPDECCGFLFGTEKGNQRFIQEAMPVPNVKEGDKTRRFVIAAKDYLKAEQYADDNNLLLLGVYHSHPNHPSIPSEHDRVVAQPYFSYIIVSIHNRKFNSLQSWRLNENFQFEEEIVEILEETPLNQTIHN